MICTCGNTLELSPDGMHCLSCAHASAMLDDDGDIIAALEAFEPVAYSDEDEEAFNLDFDDALSPIDTDIDAMYLLFDY
jgi:hypothetical protein